MNKNKNVVIGAVVFILLLLSSFLSVDKKEQTEA